MLVVKPELQNLFKKALIICRRSALTNGPHTGIAYTIQYYMSYDTIASLCSSTQCDL